MLTRHFFYVLQKYDKILLPERSTLLAINLTRSRLAASPCAPTRPARGMSGFWVRQVRAQGTLVSRANCSVGVCPFLLSRCAPTRLARGMSEFGTRQVIAKVKKHLPSLKPEHTTGRSGRSARQAGSKMTERRQNSSPWTQASFVFFNASRTQVLSYSSSDFAYRTQNPDISRAGRVGAHREAARRDRVRLTANRVDRSGN